MGATAQAIAEQIQERAATTGSTVVLFSGGSAIKMYAEAFSLLPADLSLASFTFGLVDERRGEPGHADSNETQLRAAGVVAALEQKGAKFVPMLSPTALADYTELCRSAEYLIVLAGIGDDGHTLGWLPTHTPQKFHQLYDTPEVLSDYDVDPQDSNNPFIHRVTITLSVIRRAELVIAYATGEKKLSALQSLKNWSTTATPRTQYNSLPVAALSETKNPVQIFTDQDVMGDEEVEAELDLAAATTSNT